MITDSASPAAILGGPDIHVWMTPDEAAKTLSVAIENVERQLDEGDLDSRVNEEGMLEVLICLPKRSSAAPADPESVIESVEEFELEITDAPQMEPEETQLSLARENTEPVTLGQTMLPLIHAMRHTHTSGDEIRRARRSARRAWLATAAMFVLAGGAVAASATYALRTRDEAAQLAQRIDRSFAESATLINDKETLAAKQETLQEANADLTAKLDKLNAEHERLQTQLSQTTESLSKAQGDLVVERNVEDQLLQAALASHAAKGNPNKNPVVADTSN